MPLVPSKFMLWWMQMKVRDSHCEGPWWKPHPCRFGGGWAMGSSEATSTLRESWWHPGHLLCFAELSEEWSEAGTGGEQEIYFTIVRGREKKDTLLVSKRGFFHMLDTTCNWMFSWYLWKARKTRWENWSLLFMNHSPGWELIKL